MYHYVKKNLISAMKEEQKFWGGGDRIWVCWLQGMENAPAIVKSCYKALLNKAEHPVVLLNDTNYSDYVELPEFIISKYRNGCISRTHFSDILRTALLYQNGGLWIDSTMLLTGKIPLYVWNSDMFCFKFHPDKIKWQVASSQFIRAHAGNKILGRTLSALYYYWDSHNKIKDYFLYHYIFAVAVNLSCDTKKLFFDIPVRYSEENHIMQAWMFKKFIPDDWEWLKARSFVHKLTYKVVEDKKDDDTYYKHIINL